LWAFHGGLTLPQYSGQADMVKLDRIIFAWSGVSAHWLSVPGSRFKRFRWGGRQVSISTPATSQLVCRVVSATRA
jgi:hypothetical protein